MLRIGWLVGGGVVALLAVLFARRRRPPSPSDLGVISEGWIAEHTRSRDLTP